MYRPEWGILEGLWRIVVMTAAARFESVAEQHDVTVQSAEQSPAAARAKDFSAPETIGNGDVIRKNAQIRSKLDVVLIADLANP